MVKLLCDVGVDKENKDGYLGGTPLFAASENGHTEVVKILLEAGVEKDGASGGILGATPLIISCQNGFSDIVKL